MPATIPVEIHKYVTRVISRPITKVITMPISSVISALTTFVTKIRWHTVYVTRPYTVYVTRYSTTISSYVATRHVTTMPIRRPAVETPRVAAGTGGVTKRGGTAVVRVGGIPIKIMPPRGEE